jgi:CO/xanthine dehydrogenase FAD-binding subunit
VLLHRPSSVVEALDLVDESDPASTRFYAGGVEVGFALQRRELQCRTLIDTKRIGGAVGVTRAADHVTIGPATTHDTLAHDEIVKTELPMLASACSRLGTMPIRMRGTLGGNFGHGHQHTDPGAASMAYGGSARLVSTAGTRVVPLDEFWLGPNDVAVRPGELIESIEITPLGPEWISVYDRFEQFHRPPTATVALAFQLDNDGSVTACRLAVGGIPARPMRLPSVETGLIGRRSQDVQEAMRELESLLSPLVRAETDSLGSADFKVTLLAGLIRRAAYKLFPLS